MTSSPLEAARIGLPEFEPTTTAHIRTDLDAFSEVEIAALRYQGYQLADRFARWFVADSKSPFRNGIDPLKNDPPVDLDRMPDDADHILCGSALLAGRFTRVHPWMALVLSVIVAVLCFETHLLTWSQMRTYLDEPPAWAERWLGPERTVISSSVAAVKATWRYRFGNTSIFTIVLAGWTLWSIRGHLWRKWIGRRKRGVLSHAWQRFKGKWWNVVTSAWRVPNLITLGAVLMFVFTLRPKWLLGVLPLWSVVAFLAFVVARYVFTPLWMRAGKLKPRSSVMPTPVFPDTSGG
jgi:hypothetical protein